MKLASFGYVCSACSSARHHKRLFKVRGLEGSGEHEISEKNYGDPKSSNRRDCEHVKILRHFLYHERKKGIQKRGSESHRGSEDEIVFSLIGDYRSARHGQGYSYALPLVKPFPEKDYAEQKRKKRLGFHQERGKGRSDCPKRHHPQGGSDRGYHGTPDKNVTVLANPFKFFSLRAKEGEQNYGDHESSEEPEKRSGFRVKVVSLKRLSYGVGKRRKKSGGYQKKIALYWKSFFFLRFVHECCCFSIKKLLLRPRHYARY